MLDRLLQINREAFAARHFDVAYHLLMAALHLVDHARDQQGLERIAQVATEQGAAMTPATPLYRLFETLGVHIDAVRLRMDSAAQTRRRSGTAP
jgi:hypothetical protein